MLSRRRRCSSFNAKSIRSQSQNRLGDDVLLDLVRSAVDRGLAPIEVMRRLRAGPFRPDGWLVPALAFIMRYLVRKRIGTDCLHQQLADRLLDFRSTDLQYRRGGIRLSAVVTFRGDHAQ